MANYYLFDRDCVGRWIDASKGTNQPLVDWFYWRQGNVIPEREQIPNPITFTLRPYNPHSTDDSHHMPSFLRASAPIFSDKLLEALRDCGVDNLVTYPCHITDPDSGDVYKNYKSVNIIGLVSAADMEKSNATVHPNGPARHDVDFDGLTIDNDKTNEILFFRLAESTNAIIVHQQVKDTLIAKGFTDLAFYETEKIAL
ncbi:imm11 family protein [Alkalimarinus alittae]|uniref:Immunity MXAN-0049 protein domain-containing protein n=1 Tax=Alkalimarinus alittae TaxID=2961619 RepID=A0ABY6N5R7_9ALTE|nr:DUF1629 domain-containing protein [Alkalimarinus alittae]UZE97467.1 hypothetical protein NKI27_06910 [Alkalimarinus alittae]